jgi:putative transposase
MDQPSVRKTSQEQLRPTPTQERQLEAILWRCRALYNVALEQRITAYQRCHVSITRYQQEAELKVIRAAFPEYAAIHSHVLQEVLARLEKTYQAFFCRVQRGERAGFPRFQDRDRWHCFTYKEYGNSAQLDNGFLVLAKIGRIAVRWSRPVAGTIKTVTVSHEADGWYVCFSCVDVQTQSLPLTGRETGIDRGLQVFLTTADGQPVENPRHYRTAERALKKAQLRVSRRKQGSRRRRTAVQVLSRKASARAPAAHRLPPQDGARTRARIRRDLCRGHLTCQLESPSRPQAGRARHLRTQWGQSQSRPQ